MFDELARMDGLLFEASFVSCRAETANAIFADDVKFYHDETGFAAAEQVRENTIRLADSCPGEQGVTRILDAESVEVHPISGYGAIQMEFIASRSAGLQRERLRSSFMCGRRQATSGDLLEF